MRRALLAAALLALGAGTLAVGSEGTVDALWDAYWRADGLEAQEEAARALLDAGADFGSAWERLCAGRPYVATVPTGARTLTHVLEDGTGCSVTIHVPEDYDPSRPHAVLFFLHGGLRGIRRDAGEEGISYWSERFGGSGWIVVCPSAWQGTAWWSDRQAENLDGILDILRRTYRVDPDRVFLSGFSDGAAGVYALASRNTTPWAAFLAFHGHPARAALDPEADAQMYAANLGGKPWWITSGGLDPLYPPEAIAPLLDLLRRAGAEVTHRPRAEGGHDWGWIEAEEPALKAFLRSTVRDPLPDVLSWETERPDACGRAHWVVVEALGAARGEASFEDLNCAYTEIPRLRLGISFAEGTAVTEVSEGSPAARAGVAAGDIVVETQGQAVSSADEVRTLVRAAGFGAPFRLVVERAGARVDLRGEFPPRPEPVTREAMPHPLPSGRIDARRERNTVEVRTRGIRRYRLLLSPEEFDFSLPVRVVTNGEVSFEGPVRKDPGVLLRWHARDNDPSLLFGATVVVDLPEG